MVQKRIPQGQAPSLALAHCLSPALEARAARAGRRAAVAERTNPYAASSSNESDDKPETNSPLPFPSARELWKEAEHSGACQRFKEWVKLAKLVM
eukprot:scaffold266849_cov18-Tisochrysis_lutea.AAC.1